MITETVEYLHKASEDRKIPSSHLEYASMVKGKSWLKTSMPKAHASLVLYTETMKYVVLYKSEYTVQRLRCVPRNSYEFSSG